MTRVMEIRLASMKVNLTEMIVAAQELSHNQQILVPSFDTRKVKGTFPRRTQTHSNLQNPSRLSTIDHELDAKQLMRLIRQIHVVLPNVTLPSAPLSKS